MVMSRNLLLIVSVLYSLAGMAQQKSHVRVRDESGRPLAHVTLEWLRTTDSSLLTRASTDSLGVAQMETSHTGKLVIRASLVGFQTKIISAEPGMSELVLIRDITTLSDVQVTSRKPPVRILPDKTIVNVEAGITNAGATVMEVLERSPGITVDRNGNISLKGKSGVLILIDDKQVYVSGSDLNNLLSGMNASQVDVIEIMDNPPARYDAAGNAGIINIKTKKNKQDGWNGNLTLSYGQGRYPKTNNSLLLNFRKNRTNVFLNYTMNANEYFMDLEALRTYYKPDGVTKESRLSQPFFTMGGGQTHTLRTGFDQQLGKSITIGVTLVGTDMYRYSESKSEAGWLGSGGQSDSVIHTFGENKTDWRNGGINVNGRKQFGKKGTLLVDLDHFQYKIINDQYFENEVNGPGAYSEKLNGHIPSTIRIYTGKLDYEHQFESGYLLEAGWKSAGITTENIAGYLADIGNGWEEDLGKSNHFRYRENIHAAYLTGKKELGDWSIQAGIRFERTKYTGHQLGNILHPDSAFTRKYRSLFPSLYFQYQIDSQHRISLTSGRRIDRPAFQKLNPFVFVINKYTYQEGNPYFLPQYAWNWELGYTYKENINASFSYSQLRDYISQIFYADTATGLIRYTEGNIGKLRVYGVSLSAQISPLPWWSATFEGIYNHKIIEGNLWRVFRATIHQFQLNMGNQFRFGKGWTGECSGFYIGRNQNDIQEILEPNGQLSLGVAKQILKNKATLKLTGRDLLYTIRMAGWTEFERSTEYFSIKRDSRTLTLSFSWRFGKTNKPTRRSTGGAEEEINRVGG